MEHENKLKLNIQLFAEEEGETNTDPTEGTPLTFDEILSDKEYQSEFDKRVAKSLETAKAKWQSEYESKLQAEKTEAEKLAKMNADEKLTYERDQALQKAQEFEAKYNAYELKDQALKLAKEKNIDVSLLELIDFTKENAETVNVKIDTMKSVYDKAIENAVNGRLKQDTPKQYQASKKEDDDPYIRGFKNA